MRIFQHISNQSKAAFWAIVSAMCFAGLMILNKKVSMADSPHHLPTILIIWGRCFFAACLILPFFKVKDLFVSWPWQCVRGLCAAGAMLCTYSAYHLLKLHEAAILGTAGPLFIMLFAILLLGEHVNWRRWAVLGLGFVGVVIIIGAKSFHALQGHPDVSPFSDMLIMVGSNIFSALVIILGRFLAVRKISATNTLWYGTAVPLIVYSFLAPFFWISLTVMQWKILALLGVFGVGSAGSYLMALRFAPASFLAPFEYLRPCILIPAEYLLWRRVPTVYDYIGAAFIVGASVWLTHMSRKQAFT